MALQLKTVSRTQGNNAALKDGRVRPATCTLDFEEVPVLIHAFRRMVRELAYDVSEMALTTYLCARAYGKPFTALPVFLVRAFHHGAIAVSATSRIENPRDLEGKRVGVDRGYTVTTGLWARSILHHQYGVDLNSITWVLSGDEHVQEYQPPPNVVPVQQGATLIDLLLAGDLAAVIGSDIKHADVRPLIPDAEGAGYAALRQSGHYPINHTIVVRNEHLAAHPELSVDLFNAFSAAKRLYVDELKQGRVNSPTSVDRLHQRVMEITGWADPLPYGIAPNRAVIEEVIRSAVEQRIIDQPVAVEELFPTNTHGLVG